VKSSVRIKINLRQTSWEPHQLTTDLKAEGVNWINMWCSGTLVRRRCWFFAFNYWRHGKRVVLQQAATGCNRQAYCIHLCNGFLSTPCQHFPHLPWFLKRLIATSFQLQIHLFSISPVNTMKIVYVSFSHTIDVRWKADTVKHPARQFVLVCY
jgi:hypothetical protein